MAECINFESYFQRREYTCYEFKPENCKEWTVKNIWLVNPSVIQNIILIKEDYFESYYYADLEITSVFQKCDAMIVRSERATSNNIQFVINGDEYSCFEGYLRIDNTAQEQMYRYKITLTPIFQFKNEIFRKPGKRTKIDLLEGLKKFSSDISSLKDADYYDIILCCGSRKVKAHRNILAARSTLFYKFLRSTEEDEEIKKCLQIERNITSDGNGDYYGDEDSGRTITFTEKSDDVENGLEGKKCSGVTTMFTEEREDNQNNFEKEAELSNKDLISVILTEEENKNDDSLEIEKANSNNNDESSAMSTAKGKEEQERSKSNQENDDCNDNSRTSVKSEKHEEDQKDSETKINVTIMSAEEGEVQNVFTAESPFDKNACKVTTSTDDKEKDHGVLEIEEKTFDKNNDGVSATYKEDYEIKKGSEPEIPEDYGDKSDTSDECEARGDECEASGDECEASGDECGASDDDCETENDSFENGSKIKFEDNAEALYAKKEKNEQKEMETKAVFKNNVLNFAKCTEKENETENRLEIKQETFYDNGRDDDTLNTSTENKEVENSSETGSKFFSMADNNNEDPNILIVRLKNIYPSIFDDLIDFIYSGRYKTFESQKAKDLLIAARTYGVYDLENKCIMHLKKQISMDTCDDIYSFAREIKCEKLQIYVLDFIKNKIIRRRQENDDFIAISEEEKAKWMGIMRTHTSYLSNILKVKKNKKIKDVLWGDVKADCAKCLEDLLDVCGVCSDILNDVII